MVDEYFIILYYFTRRFIIYVIHSFSLGKTSCFFILPYQSRASPITMIKQFVLPRFTALIGFELNLVIVAAQNLINW